MAFVVDNYLVDTGGSYGYSRLNVDAAVVQSNQRFHRHQCHRVQPRTGAAISSSSTILPRRKPESGCRPRRKGPRPCPASAPTATAAGRMHSPTPAPSPPSAIPSPQAAGDVQGRLRALKVDTFDYRRKRHLYPRQPGSESKTINGWVLEYPLAAASCFRKTPPVLPREQNEWRAPRQRSSGRLRRRWNAQCRRYTAPGCPAPG